MRRKVRPRPLKLTRDNVNSNQVKQYTSPRIFCFSFSENFFFFFCLILFLSFFGLFVLLPFFFFF